MTLDWNPWEHPCVPVLTPASNRAVYGKLSLIDTFRRSEEITDLYGDTSGETVVLLEWLIALIHAAGAHPASNEEWLTWVNSRTPLENVAQWIESEDLPGIFDQERPLGQDSALVPYLDTYGVGPAQLVMEHAGDYNQLADHHHLHWPDPIPADRAWRAMLTQHAYGIGLRGRIKAKDMGLPATYTNLGTGRLANRIRVVVRPMWTGATLGDLLRLNTLPWGSDVGQLNLTWRQANVTRRDFNAPGPRQTRMPTGPADLFSVLGRSVALRPVRMADGSVGVDRVLIGAGETLKELPGELVPDVVKGKPLRSSLVRQTWRESHNLYEALTNPEEHSIYQRVSLLGRPVSLWTSGLVSETGKLVMWVSDMFPCPPTKAHVLLGAARSGSEMCEYGASALYAAAGTARSNTYPVGSPEEKQRQIAKFDARPSFWQEAAGHFHTMMENAVTEDDALKVFGERIRDLLYESFSSKLVSLPDTGRGIRVRSFAEDKLRSLLVSEKAPEFLREGP